MKRVFYLLLCLVLGIGISTAQTRSVTGTVISADDGEPIIGATVVVKGTTIGSVTNIDGEFSLEVPTAATTLTISYVGMESQEIPVQPNVRVVLQTSSQALEEVLIVAYGTAKKSSFTGSAATVNSDDLQKRQVSNITKALDGLTPGVTTTTGSGQPGEGSDIYIRGYGSINASNTPLYVVDGIPFDGTLSSINPSDIENITVLKDASAGALYGSRGANGVVMITTKKGSKGKTDVNLKATIGVANRAIPRYKTMNSKQYIESLYSAYYNRQVANGISANEAGMAALKEMAEGATRVFGNNEQYNPYNLPVNELIDINTGKIKDGAALLWEDDWLDEVNRKNALRMEYVMSISGGQETTQYMFSLGYLNEQGILKTTDFERFSGRMNVETKPKDWFSAGMGANFSRNNSNAATYPNAGTNATSNVWSSAMLMGPIFPVYERDRENGGAFVTDKDGNKVFDYGVNRPAGQQQNFNSIATLYDDKYQTVSNNLSGRTHLDFGDAAEGWSNGLKLSLNFGFDYYDRLDVRYYNPYFGNAASSNGRLRDTKNTTFSYTLNQLLNYNKTFDKHNIDILVAHEWYSYEIKKLIGEKTGFPFGGLYELDGASTISAVYGSKDIYSIESYFGRVNYNFDNKYYISGSYRKDGSSRFHKDNRWGNFWSLGGNYRVSEEEFMQGYEWIDNLSVRASYGVQGNDAILMSDKINQNYYPWQSLYDLNYSNANLSGGLIKEVANKDISWETSQNFNVGMDLSAFGRLHLGLEWYSRKTTDMLLYYPLALSSGFDGYFRNAGNVRNSGLEVTVSGQVMKMKDFDWTMTVMASTLKNKVLKLTESGQDILDGDKIIREGEAIYSYYLTRSAGVDPETGSQLYWATVTDDGQETDPYITSNETAALNSRYVAGSKFAKLSGSITNGFRYKDFDFSIQANYSIGGQMIDNVYQNLMSFYYPGQAKHIDLEKAWKQPGDITDVPKYELSKTKVAKDSDLINASYLALKNITFGYTLPSKMLRGIGFKDLRFAFVADNICVFSHLKGMDPQYNMTGGTSYVYTPARILSLSIDAKF